MKHVYTPLFFAAALAFAPAVAAQDTPTSECVAESGFAPQTPGGFDRMTDWGPSDGGIKPEPGGKEDKPRENARRFTDARRGNGPNSAQTRFVEFTPTQVNVGNSRRAQFTGGPVRNTPTKPTDPCVWEGPTTTEDVWDGPITAERVWGGPTTAESVREQGRAYDSKGGPGAAPAVAELRSPSPNPTTGSTTVRYALSATADVRVTVYDVTGREVAVVADARQEAGAYDAALDASRLAPGAYVVHLATSDGQADTARLTVAR